FVSLCSFASQHECRFIGSVWQHRCVILLLFFLLSSLLSVFVFVFFPTGILLGAIMLLLTFLELVLALVIRILHRGGSAMRGVSFFFLSLLFFSFAHLFLSRRTTASESSKPHIYPVKQST